MSTESENRRILIFNVNWLGDVLFSTAAIRNIRRNYPQSFIACIINSRCFQVLKGNPQLDEIIIFDEKDRHRSPLAKLNFIRTLRRKKFDAVFLLHRSFSRAFICWCAGIPRRIGYYTRKRGFLLSEKIPAPALEGMHRIDYYLGIVEKAGLRIEDRYTEFFISGEDRQHVENYLKEQSVEQSDFLAALNPAGNWLPKRWPAEYWADLADRLLSELKAKVIITGSAGDRLLCERIRKMMRGKPILACGRLNLKQLAALSKRADLFITADTGPLHIANAAGAKMIIALFGPTSPRITGPYPVRNTVILKKDVGCKVPCYAVNCRDNRCMKAITPSSVIEQVKALFAR